MGRPGERDRSEGSAGRSLAATVRVLADSVAGTVRSLHGPLFVAGVAVSLVQVGILISLGLAVSLLFSGVLARVASALSAAALIVTLPLYVGVYVAVDESARGIAETVRTATRAVRADYRRLLVADLVALGVAIAGGVLAVSGWLGIDVVARYARLAVAGTALSASWAGSGVAPAAFAVGFFVTALVVRFADAFVCLADARPRRAWRWSVRFVRSSPPIFVGYVALVVSVTAVTALWAPTVPDATVLLSSPPAFGLAVATGAASVTVAGAFHATFFREAVEPSVDDGGLGSAPLLADRRRVAAALLLLLAAALTSGLLRA